MSKVPETNHKVEDSLEELRKQKCRYTLVMANYSKRRNIKSNINDKVTKEKDYPGCFLLYER